MAQDTSTYGFSEFADLEFYRTVNARLLDLAEIGKQRRIIDLGCGTGGITKLIIDRLQACRETVIYGIDHSAAAIRTAINELGDRRDAVVKFVQAEVQNLSHAVRERVDTVVYCNSIHYVPDKRALLRQINDQLTPGGIFAFNSTFYDGAHVPESQEFYQRWMMRSLRALKRQYGLTPARADKTEARRQLRPDQYEELLNEQGFKVRKQEEVEVEFPIEGFYHISGFSDFIEGVFPGVPLDKGSAALQQGVREVFEQHQLKYVPRNWLEVVAVRV